MSESTSLTKLHRSLLFLISAAPSGIGAGTLHWVIGDGKHNVAGAANKAVSLEKVEQELRRLARRGLLHEHEGRWFDGADVEAA